MAIEGTTKMREGDVFESYIFGDWWTFDPHLAFDEASRHIVENVYELPIIGDPSGTATLGASFRDRDHRAVVIQLGRNGCFSTGREVEVEDIRYSLVRAMTLAGEANGLQELCACIWGNFDVTTQHKIRTRHQLLDAIETYPEQSTVVLRLARSCVPAPAILENWLFIVDSAWAKRRGDWDGSDDHLSVLEEIASTGTGLGWEAAGSGPYSVAERRNGEVRLTRNPYYVGEQPFFREIRIRRLDDPVDRATRLNRIECDFAVCGRQGLKLVESSPELRVYDGLPEWNVNPLAGFTLELETGPHAGSGELDGAGIPSRFFEDEYIRRSFSYAFDYVRFHREGLGGKGRRAVGPIPSRVSAAAWDEELVAKAPSFDTERARWEWEHALDGELFRRGCVLDIVTHEGNPERIFAAEILADGLRQIAPNSTFNVVPLEWTKLLSTIRAHQAPIFWLGWQADYRDPHNFARGLLHSSGFLGRAQRLRFPNIDALVEQALAEEDEDARARSYREMNSVALEVLPHIYTFERDRFVVLHRSVEGLRFNPLRASVFSYLDLRRV